LFYFLSTSIEILLFPFSKYTAKREWSYSHITPEGVLKKVFSMKKIHIQNQYRRLSPSPLRSREGTSDHKQKNSKKSNEEPWKRTEKNQWFPQDSNPRLIIHAFSPYSICESFSSLLFSVILLSWNSFNQWIPSLHNEMIKIEYENSQAIHWFNIYIRWTNIW
jgi:hypothetical protein